MSDIQPASADREDSTRTLVIHHDDLGGSHSANMGFVELFDLGVVTCGSVMVTCPWFAEVAQMARERGDLDIGVHLTLNAEFPGYRWRPLTNGPSLMDADGFMWSEIEDARRASPVEVRTELRRQIELAYDAGIDVTHLDSHSGTVWQPEFIDIYLELGREYQLPILLTGDVAHLSAPHQNLDSVFAELRARGNPHFGKFITTPFGNLEPEAQTYMDLLSKAEPGLNWCGFHFAKPGDIESISDDASTRIREYEIFASEQFLEYLKSAEFQLTGMRELRDRMPCNT